MPVFAYRGRSGAGVVAGEIEADDRPGAVAQLRAKGVIATSVQERRAKAAAVKKIGGSVRDKALAIYTRQFSTMVDAGLPIAQCLSILSEQSDSKTLRDVTKRITTEVEGGAALDFGRDALRDVAQGLGVALLRQNREALSDRQTGVDHRGELACIDREGLVPDGAADFLDGR